MSKIRNTWDCYTDKAQYTKKNKQTVNIILETDVACELLNDIHLQIGRLSKVWKKITKLSWQVDKDRQYAIVDTGVWEIGGYGVEVYWKDALVCATAFDVVMDYKDNIRYGFLSRFSEKDIEEEDVLYANKLHLNLLQFYDWMYRHDELISPQVCYKNPMGCDMSREAIETKIKACRKYGIRPYAYGAVYAAGKDFYENHKDWAMYRLDKEPIMFADWLVYMNIADGSGWNGYIKKQFMGAIEQFGFLGIHMDTYGYPKAGWDYQGNKINLAKDFHNLINQTKVTVMKADPEAGVIFNAVNDWPMDAVALTDQDGIYIEVWPPHNTYRDLNLLIQKAYQLSGKQVVLAAYMKPFDGIKTEEDYKRAEHACLLTFAVIHASGGHQLIFGENGGALVDGYYVNYAALRNEFLPMVRSYNDFVVRFSELLYAKDAYDVSMTAFDGINEDIIFGCLQENVKFSSCGENNKIWCMIKEWRHYVIISMINLLGVNDQWNELKNSKAIVVSDIRISLLLEKKINGIYYSTPDDPYCRVQELQYSITSSHLGRRVEVVVPSLQVWSYVWIDFSEEGE